ncbi:unnamed protein product [Euphydryas editha]|uniref:Transposase n=1 Tax=Euphydryas editha TaxID=104508 RepID=A0AAU9UYI5_EUPED|nr:unnamed protein product [Euphydryas editha]
MLHRFQTVNSILWSDEAHFHLNGHVKKQNCLYWAPRTRNPRLKHQKPLLCSRRVARNIKLRFEQCVQLDRRHLDHIIFKK